MSIPTYNLGYPQNGSTLGQSKATIRNNLDGTFQTLGVDHVNNNGVSSIQAGNYPAGYHSQVSMIPLSSDPAHVGSYGHLYTKSITTGGNLDQVLFYETGGGRITQFTTNIAGAANTTNIGSGYSTLFGGLYFLWGNVTFGGVFSGKVQYPIAFANNGNIALNIQTSPLGTSASTGSLVITGSLPVSVANPNGGFTYQIAGTTTGYSGFYWIAIGY